MTLPINYKLPEVNEDQTPEEMNSYLKDLIFELQNMYERMAQNINGTIRNNRFVDGSEWVPILKPSGISGTITYTNQTGWVLRQGLMTDVWFTVNWTGIGTSTGNIFLDLPYKVTKTIPDPFIGTALTGGQTFTVGHTGIVSLAVRDTFLMAISSYGTGLGASNVPLAASGFVAGHVRYIGVENE